MSQIDDYLRSGRSPGGIATGSDYSDGSWIPGGRSPRPDGMPDHVDYSDETYNIDYGDSSGFFRDGDIGMGSIGSEPGVGFDGSNINSDGSRDPDWRSFDAFLDNLLNDPDLYNITDRSQIINPEEILSRFKFGTSDAEVARYNKALQALRNIQAQQEVAFEEWYNSTSQQAIRDREAGLNTDILGISGQSQASGVSQQTESPYDGVTTDETRMFEQQSLRLQKFQSVMSAVSSICNIPATFASAFGALTQGKASKASSQLTQLQMLKEFESLAGGEISSRLTDSISSALEAGQSLDLVEWFGNDDNFSGILESYSPPGTDFSASFANVRKRMQRTLGSAYGEGKVTADNQGSFSALLADPRYSSDQLVQIAHLKPYMKARTDLQLLNDEYQSKVTRLKDSYISGFNVDAAVDAANAKFAFDGEYYSSRDGAAEALNEWYMKEADGIVARMRSAIQHNLFDMYDKNQNNERGFAAAYLSSANSVEWYEYLIAQELMYGVKRFSSVSSDYDTSNHSFGYPHGVPSPSLGNAQAFVPINSPASMYK